MTGTPLEDMVVRSALGDELSGLLVACKSDALAAIKGDGRLAAAWDEWLPSLKYPFTAEMT